MSRRETRKDLDSHGNEAIAVANAARGAADNIEKIKSELATVKADAESLGMEIDPVSSTVAPHSIRTSTVCTHRTTDRPRSTR